MKHALTHEAACSALTHEACIETWSGMLCFDDDDNDDDDDDDDDDADEDGEFCFIGFIFLKV